MGVQKIGLEAVLDMANFNRGMGQYNQGIDGMTGKTKGLTGILGGMGKAIAGVGAIAGGVAIAGLAAIGKGLADCAKEAAEAEEASAALDAVIKSTGRDMTKTRKMTDKYAGSLQATTRFSDEQVMAAETMLLQFESMNEKTFPEAIQLTADIATRLGTDMPSAATLLGKALAEPGEGLNRLRQAGITFTDAEEEMIKKMFEAGDVAGAQAAIMDKLQSSVGGAAVAAGDTFGGTMDRLKNSFSDIKEAIGAPILASLQTLADKLVTALGSPEVKAALDRITTWLGTNLPTAITGAINFITNAYNEVRGILEDLGLVERKEIPPPMAEGAGAGGVGGAVVSRPIIDQTIGMQRAKDTGEEIARAFGQTLTAETEQELEAANQALIPVINQWLYDTIEVPFRNFLNELPGKIEALAFRLSDAFMDAIGPIADAIYRAFDKVLPDWLMGHSPPPLANWLEQISEAGAHAGAELAGISGAIRGMPAMTTARTAAGAGGRTTNVGGDTIIQNIADPATYVLAMAIANDKKRERFAAAMGV